MIASHRQVVNEINGAIKTLAEAGFADDQNFAFEDKIGVRRFLVRYSNEIAFPSGLYEEPYLRMYDELRSSRSYNILMLDGAMLQMTYEFRDRRLIRHRLAFLPSPHLLEYQNNPDLYAQELKYADVVEKEIVAVPLRFDYDNREQVAAQLDHPVSHLTLGQYTSCRIPVTSGVTPHAFVDFVLRSFYSTERSAVDLHLPRPLLRFDVCIAPAERHVIHIAVPTQAPST